MLELEKNNTVCLFQPAGCLDFGLLCQPKGLCLRCTCLWFSFFSWWLFL